MLDRSVRNRDFVPVFPRVARARNPNLVAPVIKNGDIHEPHAGDFRHHPRQCQFGFRSLKRKQRTSGHPFKIAAIAKGRLHMGKVVILARSVHHQKQVIPTIGDHQVIQDATFGICEQTIALPVFTKPQNINGNKSFQCKCGIGYVAGFGAQQDLPHVTDIKKPCAATAGKVFLHHPKRVLNRHFIPCERNHLGAQFQVKIE